MNRRPIGVLLAVAALALAFADCGRAIAQSLNFSQRDGAPVEVYADNGIEWQQENLTFIARGNARAIRGQVTVFADELRAYYREKPNGDTEIHRLDAIGNVRIRSEDATASGGRAIYNVDDGILVLDGGRVKMVAGSDTLFADEQLEYWERKNMAVARGNAVARRADKRLRAQVLAAHFRKNKAGDNEIYRVDAFDDVKIVTQKDTALSDRGVYNVKSGIATLTGSVKILRGRNTLNGCSAEVNLNTGVSRLHSCTAPSGRGKKRVRGVILPDSLKNKSGG